MKPELGLLAALNRIETIAANDKCGCPEMGAIISECQMAEQDVLKQAESDREKPPIMRQDHDCTDECDKYIKQVQGLFAAYCETHGVEEPPGQRCEYFVRHPAKTESSLDLPERLRALARYDARDLGREGDEQFIHASTEWQAADEVERLRAIVEAVKQALTKGN